MNVPFNYSGTYPADLTTESITTPPAHGTATINADGSITYQNNNSLERDRLVPVHGERHRRQPGQRRDGRP